MFGLRMLKTEMARSRMTLVSVNFRSSIWFYTSGATGSTFCFSVKHHQKLKVFWCVTVTTVYQHLGQLQSNLFRMFCKFPYHLQHYGLDSHFVLTTNTKLLTLASLTKLQNTLVVSLLLVHACAREEPAMALSSRTALFKLACSTQHQLSLATSHVPTRFTQLNPGLLLPTSCISYPGFKRVYK